jgi:hypothetical protein
VLAGLFFALAAASGASQVEGLLSFDCERSFVADDNADTLARRFGADAVAAAEIYLGGGFTRPAPSCSGARREAP